MPDYVGYRTQKRQEKEKKHRKRWLWLLLPVALVAVFFILVAFHVSPLDKAWGNAWNKGVKKAWNAVFNRSDDTTTYAFLEKDRKTTNVLIGVTKDAKEGKYLSTLALVSYDSEKKKASIIYFPADMQISAPGLGGDVSVSELVELDDGNMEKAKIAVANLLGVDIDRAVLATDVDLNLVVKALGKAYTVAVPTAVSVSDKSLGVSFDLKPGEHEMKDKALVSYLTTSSDGDEIALVKRQMAFGDKALSESRGSDDYEAVYGFLQKNPRLMSGNYKPGQLVGLWQALSELGSDSVSQVTVPVTAVSRDRTTVHIVDRKKLDEFRKKYVKSDEGFSERLRLEIVNGCGVPGIAGKAAAEIGEPSRFDLVKFGNDPNNQDHPETIIYYYGNDKKVKAAAEQIRKSLEVGRVEQAQGESNLFDIEVILGKDYASK